MEYIFYGRYRSKVNGFQYKTLKSGDTAASNDLSYGQKQELFSNRFGPMICSMLFVGEDGRLNLYIGGMGRTVFEHKGGSPWEDGDDNKILNLFVTAETVDERTTVFALFKAFAEDPFEVGRRFLRVMIPHDDVDYSIDTVELESFVRSYTENAGPVPIFKSELKRNVMLAYYTYGDFSSASVLNEFRNHLYVSGITHLSECFFTEKNAEDGCGTVAKLLGNGCNGMGFFMRAKFERFMFALKYRF